MAQGLNGSQLREQLPVRTGFPLSRRRFIEGRSCLRLHHERTAMRGRMYQSPPTRAQSESWISTPPVESFASKSSRSTLLPFTSAARSGMLVPT